jgi:hypothetical protein
MQVVNEAKIEVIVLKKNVFFASRSNQNLIRFLPGPGSEIHQPGINISLIKPTRN